MKLKLLTVLFVAIGLTVVACGSGNNTPTNSPDNAPTPDSAKTGDDEQAPATAMVYEIGIKGMT